MKKNCNEIEMLLADALGGELGDAERMALDEHLGGCERCRREYASLVRAVGELQSLPAAPSVVVRRIGDRLVLSPAARTVRPSPIWFRWTRTAMRYAAAIVLAFVAGYMVHDQRSTVSTEPPTTTVAAASSRPGSLQSAVALQYSRNPGRTLFTSGLLAMYDSRR